MGAAAVTMRGRKAAERLMTDTCAITRATSTGTKNETTGQYDGVTETTIYTGKCRIQIKSVIAAGSDSGAGDRAATVQTLELQLPVDSTDEVTIGDVAEILTATHDPSLEGRKFTVSARHEKSQATARRLRVEEVTA